jgi:hypothetical protein
MMRSRCAGLIGMVLLIAAVLAGCQNAGPLSSDASLKSISVAGLPATLGTPSSKWKEAVAGEVTISNSMSLAASIGVEKGDGGSIVYYATAEGVAQPTFVESPSLSFSNGTFLYLEVFSANQDAVQFYKVAVTVVDDTPVLFDVLLGGRSASGYKPTSAAVQKFGLGIGTPAATYDAAVAGEVWFGSSQAGTAVAVSATAMLPTATKLRYAVASGAAAPAFGDAATATVADGSFLYVEASLGDTDPVVLIYKLKMAQKGDDRSLSSVTINGQAMTIGPMGTHSFPGEEYYGSYRNGAQLATTGNKSIYSVADVSELASIAIAATPTDAKLAIRYDAALKDTGLKDYGVFNHSPKTDNATGLFSNMAHGQYLAVQVTSEIGEKGWYTFRLVVGQTDTTITGLSIGGAAIDPVPGVLSPFYGMWLQGTLGAVTMPTPTAATAVVATLAATADKAKVEYGVSGTSYGMASIPSAWNATGVFDVGAITAANNNIVIRVTSESGLTLSYYGVKVTLAD